MVGIDPLAQTPDDPALRRLLPDAYPDDEEAAGEFRRFTERDLRAAKADNARLVGRRSSSAGTRGRSSPATRSRPGSGFLNDTRLTLGTRLEITEENHDELAGPARVRSAVGLFQVYDWLDLPAGLHRAAHPPVGLGSAHAPDQPGPRRRDGRPRARRPSRRGVRRHRRPRRLGPPRALRPDGQRRSVADVLRVRLDGPAAPVPRHGRPRRGARRHLPLAHGDRGLPVAHRRRPTPPSPMPTTCWSRPARPGPRMARSSCGRTGSSTAS